MRCLTGTDVMKAGVPVAAFGFGAVGAAGADPGLFLSTRRAMRSAPTVAVRKWSSVGRRSNAITSKKSD